MNSHEIIQYDKITAIIAKVVTQSHSHMTILVVSPCMHLQTHTKLSLSFIGAQEELRNEVTKDFRHT